jgi:hypothetical protein
MINMNKRGMEMSISTIVVIVLAIVVLTLLIVFFTSQAGVLSDNVDAQTSDSNVDAIIVACDGLVTAQSIYAYCCEKKNVIPGGDAEDVKLTCQEISTVNWFGSRVAGMDCSSTNCA